MCINRFLNDWNNTERFERICRVIIETIFLDETVEMPDDFRHRGSSMKKPT